MAMRVVLALVFGIALAANGLLMLIDPAAWYALVPGVAETGPLNMHFVRDIGCAYLVTGAALAGNAVDQRLHSAAVAGALFLTLHALVHVRDAVAGHGHTEHAATELLTVFASALLALLFVAPSPLNIRRSTMLKWLIKRQLAAFERNYRYDASYVRDILAADTRAAVKFARATGLSRYSKDVPRSAWFAAGITAVMAEDCGPCTQLAVTMAQREGIAPETLRAIVAGDVHAMPDDVLLAYRFTKATLAHDASANELREQILRLWGQRALVSLAFAITTSRIYPTVKYALGHGQACQRVIVDGKPVLALKQAA
jgi:hypothetical protein